MRRSTIFYGVITCVKDGKPYATTFAVIYGNYIAVRDSMLAAGYAYFSPSEGYHDHDVAIAFLPDDFIDSYLRVRRQEVKSESAGGIDDFLDDIEEAE